MNGEKLLEHLQSKGIRPSAFAKMCNVSSSSVSVWIRNIVIPSPKNAKKIARLTNGAIPVERWGYHLNHKGQPKKPYYSQVGKRE